MHNQWLLPKKLKMYLTPFFYVDIDNLHMVSPPQSTQWLLKNNNQSTLV
jgi:hypothetical protein